MARRTISPALFDISQDMVGDIPVELIEAWTKSAKDPPAAKKILQETLVRGVAVSSDTSGLSRLSQSKELIEVLAIINQPKEIVYALGKEIGGEGIGIWAADNTQMFYPEDVPAQDILQVLVETQTRIKERCAVQIGMGAHYGEFFKIGGGLYGPQADFIEHVTEGETQGGEIVISGTFFKRVAVPNIFQVESRDDLHYDADEILRLVQGPGLENLKERDFHYPMPFSEDFFRDLRRFELNPDHVYLETLKKMYVEQKVVVLIERERVLGDTSEVTLLNDLSLDVIMKKTAFKLLDRFIGEEIKTVGALGIYVFDDAEQAFEFANEFRRYLQKEEIGSRIGIDEGAVIIFDLKGRNKDIAGEPVNIASKMAQDYGTLGRMYLTDRVAQKLKLTNFEPFSMEVSKVKLNGVTG